MVYPFRKKLFNAKPSGLWVSVEYDGCNDSWKQWCEREEFNLNKLQHAHQIILNENANILYVTTEDELFNFTKKYPMDEQTLFFEKDSFQINWKKVSESFSGIIITPYLYGCRCHTECFWYYGWDCSSGCFWDLECISEFRKLY